MLLGARRAPHPVLSHLKVPRRQLGVGDGGGPEQTQPASSFKEEGEDLRALPILGRHGGTFIGCIGHPAVTPAISPRSSLDLVCPPGV